MVAAVLLVLLAVWGAMDLDRRIRAERHDGETWADLETWADMELDESIIGPSEDSRHLVMDLWVRTLRARDLAFPVEDVEPEDLRDDFHDPRSGGRTHNALDIFAPEGTKVLAVEDGVVTRVAKGGLGGRYVMLEDPTGTFRYYYAHLERWIWGLDEGDRVERGQTLGYVGTTGNAAADVPHLHFAIYKVIPERRGSGVPVNPWRVFAGGEDDEMPGPAAI